MGCGASTAASSPPPPPRVQRFAGNYDSYPAAMARPPHRLDAAEPKYVTDDFGVRRLNPAYARSKEALAVPASTALCPNLALPVCSDPRDECFVGVPVAPSVHASVEIFREAALQAQGPAGPAGASGTAAESDPLAILFSRFTRYEVPMGVLNKLVLLTELDALELILDDSGSMASPSRKHGTRWGEVHHYATVLVALLCHLPGCPPIRLSCLNSPETLEITREMVDDAPTPGDADADAGAPSPPQSRRLEDAIAYEARARQELHRFFQWRVRPNGLTPAYEAIHRSMHRGRGVAVARYFFGDGKPNGGKATERQIFHLLASRPAPERNPFTFVSCTDNDDYTEWMKECEEVAPYCAEMDDFLAEAREVLRDQGAAFPFTYGLYLAAMVVGAMCPDDLDALDESVPLAKPTLDNVVGYVTTIEEYRRYWGGFLDAQARQRAKRGVATALDRVKASVDWPSHFDAFCTAPRARALPVVAEYHRRLKAADAPRLAAQPSSRAAPQPPLM